MSGPQWIFIVLILLITWGGFIECSAYPVYRVAPARALLAWLLLALLIAFVAFAPWSNWLTTLPRPAPVWLEILGWIVALTFVTGISPAMFVFLIVGWVGAALTGDLQRWFRARFT